MFRLPRRPFRTIPPPTILPSLNTLSFLSSIPLFHTTLPPRISSHNYPLSTTSPLPRKDMPPRPKITDFSDESQIEEFFVKGSGPGGQKINKTNSAVQLRHIPTGIVVKCQATRSREQNRAIARRLLATRLEELEKGPLSREAIVGERKKKKADSKAKKARRKYRKLAEEKQEQEQQEQQEEEEEGEVKMEEGSEEENRPSLLESKHEWQDGHNPESGRQVHAETEEKEVDPKGKHQQHEQRQREAGKE